MRRSHSLRSTVVFLSFLAVPHPTKAAPQLYGSKGIGPEAVRQGSLGSCYFHSVVAALAQANPQALQKMIQESSGETYTVHFADGKKETAYLEDIRYSRETGYDRSDGLWVAVLFRAYAQKVLRESLVEAIGKSNLFPLLRHYAEEFVATNDPVLLAYDRAIRAQVDQNGNLDRAQLEAKLKEQMTPLPVSDEIKDSLVNLLDSGGFFASLAEMIKQNGELFGAYRAVGQGGLAERVMETLAGSVKFERNESERQAASALERTFRAHLPVVACTAGSRFYEQLAAGQTLPPGADSWYVNSHCYTVLGVDAGGSRVTLRNPWAHHPNPDGIFPLPLASFVPAFRGITTTGP